MLPSHHVLLLVKHLGNDLFHGHPSPDKKPRETLTAMHPALLLPEERPTPHRSSCNTAVIQCKTQVTPGVMAVPSIPELRRQGRVDL